MITVSQNSKFEVGLVKQKEEPFWNHAASDSKRPDCYGGRSSALWSSPWQGLWCRDLGLRRVSRRGTSDEPSRFCSPRSPSNRIGKGIWIWVKIQPKKKKDRFEREILEELKRERDRKGGDSVTVNLIRFKMEELVSKRTHLLSMPSIYLIRTPKIATLPTCYWTPNRYYF